MNLNFATLTDLQKALRNRDVSATELTQHYLTRIDALDPALNSFISIQAETALDGARRADEHAAARLPAGPFERAPTLRLGAIAPDRLPTRW